MLEVLLQPLHHREPPLAYLPSYSSLVEVVWELLEADKHELEELMDLGNHFTSEGFATSFPAFPGKAIVLSTSIVQIGSGTWIPTLEWLQPALNLEKKLFGFLGSGFQELLMIPAVLQGDTQKCLVCRDKGWIQNHRAME